MVNFDESYDCPNVGHFDETLRLDLRNMQGEKQSAQSPLVSHTEKCIVTRLAYNFDIFWT